MTGVVQRARMARAGRKAVALLILTSVLWAGAASAADGPPPGAAACSGCHPPTQTDGPFPSLVGRPAAEIVAQMQAFRTGAVPATVMDRIAKGFSDEEIRSIAEWLSSVGAQRAAKP